MPLLDGSWAWCEDGCGYSPLDRGLLENGHGGQPPAKTLALAPSCIGAVTLSSFPNTIQPRRWVTGHPFLLAVLPTSPPVSGCQLRLLPLGPTAAPQVVSVG